MNIVTLCTGNVARSVMLGYMLTSIADAKGEEWRIRTAGTHVGEGAGMSARTRDALLKIEGLGDHQYGAHRSHQLVEADMEWAEIVLAAEAVNVNYARTNFASHAEKAIQLAQFVRYAPLEGDITEKMHALSAREPSAEFDVADPAGGDQSNYDECARRLWDLAQAFALIVGDDRLR